MPICVSYKGLDGLQRKLKTKELSRNMHTFGCFLTESEAEEMYSAISELKRLRKRMAKIKETLRVSEEKRLFGDLD